MAAAAPRPLISPHSKSPRSRSPTRQIKNVAVAGLDDIKPLSTDQKAELRELQAVEEKTRTPRQKSRLAELQGQHDSYEKYMVGKATTEMVIPYTIMVYGDVDEKGNMYEVKTNRYLVCHSEWGCEQIRTAIEASLGTKEMTAAELKEMKDLQTAEESKAAKSARLQELEGKFKENSYRESYIIGGKDSGFVAGFDHEAVANYVKWASAHLDEKGQVTGTTDTTKEPENNIFVTYLSPVDYKFCREIIDKELKEDEPKRETNDDLKAILTKLRAIGQFVKYAVVPALSPSESEEKKAGKVGLIDYIIKLSTAGVTWYTKLKIFGYDEKDAEGKEYKMPTDAEVKAMRESIMKSGQPVEPPDNEIMPRRPDRSVMTADAYEAANKKYNDLVGDDSNPGLAHWFKRLNPDIEIKRPTSPAPQNVASPVVAKQPAARGRIAPRETPAAGGGRIVPRAVPRPRAAAEVGTGSTSAAALGIATAVPIRAPRRASPVPREAEPKEEKKSPAKKDSAPKKITIGRRPPPLNVKKDAAKS